MAKKHNTRPHGRLKVGLTKLPRVEEGRAPDFSLNIAWTEKPGTVASKTQVRLYDAESTGAQ